MGEAMIAYGRAEIASFLFETGEIDIEFKRGRFRVAGTPGYQLHVWCEDSGLATHTAVFGE